MSITFRRFCFQKEDVQTGDKFHVEVDGTLETEYPDTFQREPFLIIECLDVDCLGGDSIFKDLEDPKSIWEDPVQATKTLFGSDGWEFLEHLRNSCSSHDWVVMIITKCLRVARLLHKYINGGEKCLAAPSNMRRDYKYSPKTFSFAQYYKGMDWNEAYKIDLLKQIFPELQDAVVEEKVCECQSNKNSVRWCYKQLAQICAKQKGESLKQSGSSNSGCPDVAQETQLQDQANLCCGAFESLSFR